MKSLMNMSIANIVSNNINTVSIFRKFKIDFCFQGNMLLSKACEDNNVNFKQIYKELNAVNDNIYYLKDYNSWKLDFLIDFLINIHHEYEEENILFLKEYGEKVTNIYGRDHKELREINSLIKEVTDDILEHMKNEEVILFPYIKKLLNAKEKNTQIDIKDSPLNEPIDSLEDDHKKVSKAFKRISKLTNNYKIPKDACDSFKILYLKLQQFEDDLYRHIHIENNILFPKAKKLERALYKAF
jgi:regulator of cell morphogenesis and NO signaling